MEIITKDSNNIIGLKLMYIESVATIYDMSEIDNSLDGHPCIARTRSEIRDRNWQLLLKKNKNNYYSNSIMLIDSDNPIDYLF